MDPSNSNSNNGQPPSLNNNGGPADPTTTSASTATNNNNDATNLLTTTVFSANPPPPPIGLGSGLYGVAPTQRQGQHNGPSGAFEQPHSLLDRERERHNNSMTAAGHGHAAAAAAADDSRMRMMQQQRQGNDSEHATGLAEQMQDGPPMNPFGPPPTTSTSPSLTAAAQAYSSNSQHVPLQLPPRTNPKKVMDSLKQQPAPDLLPNAAAATNGASPTLNAPVTANNTSAPPAPASTSAPSAPVPPQQHPHAPHFKQVFAGRSMPPSHHAPPVPRPYPPPGTQGHPQQQHHAHGPPHPPPPPHHHPHSHPYGMHMGYPPPHHAHHAQQQHHPGHPPPQYGKGPPPMPPHTMTASSGSASARSFGGSAGAGSHDATNMPRHSPIPPTAAPRDGTTTTVLAPPPPPTLVDGPVQPMDIDHDTKQPAIMRPAPSPVVGRGGGSAVAGTTTTTLDVEQQQQKGPSPLPQANAFGHGPPGQDHHRGGPPPIHRGNGPAPPSMDPTAPPMNRPSIQPPQQQGPPAPAAAMHQQQQQGNGGGQWRELRVEDALNYLDHVKMEFKDRPKVYNQFLAIMKNFKSQEVDTPGVIRMVSKLFRGYNSLILGFNTFLPDGYKISLADLERQEEEDRLREANESAAAGGGETAVASPHSRPTLNVPRGPSRVQAPWGAPSGAAAGPPSGRSPYEQQQLQQQVSIQQPPPQQQPPSLPIDNRKLSSQAAAAPKEAHAQPPMHDQQQQPQRSPPQQQQQQHQAVEFDHAISYVTKIKRRFASDPSTYHKFLEILHTYQKEQRGIKEVLEQVAGLFADHPDLLKEFTFFLPDAVQEQAKERLHRAAAESESRIAKAQQEYLMHGAGAAQPSPHHLPPAGQHKLIDMTRSQQMALAESARKRSHDAVGGETVVYNSAVERQFFDAAREALTSYSRDGGQAWAEFIKCLDMYAQDILSRSEMLNFVEPLLGKRNTKLFEEFKRILNAAGSSAHPLPFLEDSWYSVPLSEIDFSRCRRCSPSYRALPRDYALPPTGDRSEEEKMVLNDVWVSLPVGSEESYTFRHMRRNVHEETLFRVEDERFEIDMAIDSNAATLHRLEPIAEEIALLSQEDPVIPDLGSKLDGFGLGGKRFQYMFDKSILGVIHRNSITRIYGDSGSEVLELMHKNPTVAIPLVVERLRQKAAEWRLVRDRLNRNWKELAQANYYKSVDHRGLTWRAVDKRITSTRALILEIKDRALHGGKEGPEALKQKLDKAKEEHGSFYEVTMKGALSKNLDLTFLPKPDRRLFTPHLSIMFENNSWAQRDAYRILAFALERGQTSPADKERCHRLWIEFFGPIFGLDLSWMERPAVTYMESHTAPRTFVSAKASVVSDIDEDDIMEDVGAKGVKTVTEELHQNGIADPEEREFTDYHPLPSGAHVSTLYGEGKIIQFRRSDHVYVVQLQFGSVGYLRPATVLCSILPVEKSAYTRELCSSDLSKLARPGDQLAMGTQSLYLFFYMHQILIHRLNIAKRLAYEVGEDESLKTLVEQMPNCNRNAVGRRRYEAFLSLVYGLLDGGVGGTSDGEKYEDRVRGLLGHGSYELATMDKLISHIWKNIQQMAGDETMWNLVQLYRRHLKSTSGFQPEAFRQEAAYQSEGEQMYAFQYCPMPGQDKAVLHMEYIGVMEDENDDSEDEDSASDDGRGRQLEPVPVAEPQAKRSRR